MRNQQRFGQFVFLACLLAAGQACAAGSVTVVTDPPSCSATAPCVYVVDWVGGADGSVPATAIFSGAGFVTRCVTSPGITPSTDYDVTLQDSSGLDVMGGTLADLSPSATEPAVPLLFTDGAGQKVYGDAQIYGGLTLRVSNQSNAAATGRLIIYVDR